MIIAESQVRVRTGPESVLSYFRHPANLARLLEHVEGVRRDADGTLEFAMAAHPGQRVAWRAEFAPDKSSGVAWRSLEPDFPALGRVHVERCDDGCVVAVRLEYAPPCGTVGGAFARLLGGKGAALSRDLERLEELLEPVPA